MGRVPGATYRLQFNREFTFEAGIGIVDYLRALGITDLYSSPILQASPGSAHGYDVCSFEEVSPELGGEPGFNALTSKLGECGMGLLLDMVPNHMGFERTNAWLQDVLKHGRASRFGMWFDIDWDSPVPGLKDKVLVPTLEDMYGKVLEEGKIKLAHNGRGFEIQYYGQALPLKEESQEQLEAERGTGEIKSVLGNYNGAPGEPRSFDSLHTLLQQQHYRLAWWRSGAQIINYRRFFDVTQLIAVRMELPEVFAAAHRLVLEWCKNGKVTGLRIDHPDGLFDPREYFERLQRETGQREAGTEGRPFYLVVEKILSGEERLPVDWPVAGTTGYDFLNQVNGVFVDCEKADRFARLYAGFTGRQDTFAEEAYAGKKKVLAGSFWSDVERLLRWLAEIAAASRSGPDLTPQMLRVALTEILASFPAYRTYATSESNGLSKTERSHVEFALEGARGRASAMFLPAIDWIGSILLLQEPDDLNWEGRARCRGFVLKFQQLTGAIMAKGVEDTAFYTYNRLVSLNEVGGDPGRFGVPIDLFHKYNETTNRSWPHSLLATATHDTKRGEDVRARLNVLSEMPDQWLAAIERWRALNQPHKSQMTGESAPDANDEYLLYQTLVGAWPTDEATGPLKLFAERAGAYLLKAMRESKRNTSWTEPNEEYERASRGFVERLLDPSLSQTFHNEFRPFQRTVAFFGRLNSLSQTLLKLTSPGVPDIYQGTELWDLSLVDPDNRRPVDYASRKAILERVKQWKTVSATEMSAETKMFLIWRTLAFRNQNRELFDEGDYIPLSAKGEKNNHVCAFARRRKDLVSITVVPRLVYGLLRGEERAPVGEIWGDTVLQLPPELHRLCLKNLLTGEPGPNYDEGKIPMRTILSGFPVALLAVVEGKR